MNAQLERNLGEADGHFDVLIVGAGISGVGGAYHIKSQCPDKTFLVLEEMAGFGGTWRTHKYPGVRSDSDLYTFGYRFKPWVGAPIASGGEILKYMEEVISENGLDGHIRYGHKITNASWSDDMQRWTVDVTLTATGEKQRFTANFLWMCQGYYSHAKGYTPDWPGMDRFKGRIVHPQNWPSDLDYKDKRVIVIGSGATAATVVPAIADSCSHVTLVQRSPTYFSAGPNSNELADMLRSLNIDEAWIHEIVRRKILQEGDEFVRRCKEEPDGVKQMLLSHISGIVGPDITAQHFTPSYRPWRQRIAFVPDGDIFNKVSDGKVSVRTDHIAGFTETGLRLESGEEIEADIVITATGFNISVLGDIPFEVNGVPVDFARTVTYRGMMMTGVPNMAWTFGYFRASWTLRVDLMGDFICRMIKHMDAAERTKVTVQLRPEDKDMALSTWSNPEDFNPGYLMRGMHLMPQRGAKPEWSHSQDYMTEKDVWPAIDLDGAEFVYDVAPCQQRMAAAE